MINNKPTKLVGYAPKYKRALDSTYPLGVLRYFDIQERKKCYLTNEKKKELILAIPRVVKDREKQDIKKLYDRLFLHLSFCIATNKSVELSENVKFYNEYKKNKNIKSLSKRLFFMINRARNNG